MVEVFCKRKLKTHVTHADQEGEREEVATMRGPNASRTYQQANAPTYNHRCS